MAWLQKGFRRDADINGVEDAELLQTARLPSP